MPESQDTRPGLHPGICDACEKETTVRDWYDGESDECATVCDQCEADLRAGWEAMTDAERAAVEADIAEARAYTGAAGIQGQERS